MTKTDLIFYFIAFSGVYCHWLKKYARNELSCDFLRYLLDEPKHTLATVMTLIGALYTMQVEGIFMQLTQEHIGLVFMAGWTADSTFNKGE